MSALAKLVWATPGADDLVAYMARVSNPDNQDNVETAPKLIAYLIRHDHWSPFEMVNLCMEINTTRDIARQILRHRSFSFQEFSQRYQEIDALPTASPRPARLQDAKNRQASLPATDENLRWWWRSAQHQMQLYSQTVYEEALERGIAKEVARVVLPEGLTMSRLYMNGTLRSWLHYFRVRRLEHGAQPEHVEVAAACRAVAREVCPNIMAAYDITQNS